MPSRLAREPPNQGSRLSSPGRQKRCGLSVREWTEAGRLWAVPATGSDRGHCRVPPVVAGLDHGQLARVGWRDAGPCQEGAADFGFQARLTHTRPQDTKREKGGVDGRLPWALEARRGVAFVPCGHWSDFRCPAGGVLASSGTEVDGLAMSAEGQMGEPPWSLCCFGSRQAGLGPWTAPHAGLRRPRWSLATRFDLRDLGAAQRPWPVEGLSLLPGRLQVQGESHWEVGRLPAAPLPIRRAEARRHWASGSFPCSLTGLWGFTLEQRPARLPCCETEFLRVPWETAQGPSLTPSHLPPSCGWDG